MNNIKCNFIIDFGNVISYAKTFHDAQTTVNNEIHRTIVPRYQNDILIKNIDGEIIAILPWIGILSQDVHYWNPSTKIRQPTYGDWIIKK
ncbi:MAG: hypothetical protein LUG12_07730 [Erysipelotrichaceae bacterium]|nr:hypothetical protein [Erysipelotrichaceae bacterium]